MTTVLADLRWGVIVADTGATDLDRQWPNSRKVWRIKGDLLAFSGGYEDFTKFLQWWRAGRTGVLKAPTAKVLVMTPQTLTLFDGTDVPQRVDSGCEAIGTGAKAAMAAYDAMWRTDPRRAVQIACKHDASSRAPVRTYRI